MLKSAFDQLYIVFIQILLALVFSVMSFLIVVFFHKLHEVQVPETIQATWIICGTCLIVALKWFFALPFMPISTPTRIRFFRSQCSPPYNANRDLFSQIYYPRGEVPLSKWIFHGLLVGIVHLILAFILSAAFFEIVFSFYETYDFSISSSMKVSALFCGAMCAFILKMFILTPFSNTDQKNTV